MHSSRIFSIDPAFCVLLALSLLILPAQWVIGWLSAATIHELAHILVLKLQKVKILAIRIRGLGAVILTESMDPLQEFLCAIAGPVGGLSALILLRVCPYIALSAIIQSVYNLLPIYPLDGGRALKAAMLGLFDSLYAERITKIVSAILLISLVLFGVILSARYQLGIIPVLLLMIPVVFTTIKNSLQREGKNSTISLYVSK